jgi:hypothetical protein
LLNYSFDPGSVGKHRLLAVLDTGFEEYKKEAYYSVFEPRITIDTYRNDTSYVFDVHGPYSSYEFYVDGEGIDPHIQRNFTIGKHEVMIKWVDLAGYERLHTEYFDVWKVESSTLCVIIPAIFVLILILVSFIYRK